jgi:hypothetical protein
LIAFKEKKYLTPQKQNDWLGFVILNKKNLIEGQAKFSVLGCGAKNVAVRQTSVKQTSQSKKVESNNCWVKQMLKSDKHHIQTDVIVKQTSQSNKRHSQTNVTVRETSQLRKRQSQTNITVRETSQLKHVVVRQTSQ